MRRRLALHARSGAYARAVARVLPERTDHVLDVAAAHRWLDLADRHDTVMLFTDAGVPPDLEEVCRRAVDLRLTLVIAEITPRMEHVG